MWLDWMTPAEDWTWWCHVTSRQFAALCLRKVLYQNHGHCTTVHVIEQSYPIGYPRLPHFYYFLSYPLFVLLPHLNLRNQKGTELGTTAGNVLATISFSGSPFKDILFRAYLILTWFHACSQQIQGISWFFGHATGQHSVCWNPSDGCLHTSRTLSNDHYVDGRTAIVQGWSWWRLQIIKQWLTVSYANAWWRGIPHGLGTTWSITGLGLGSSSFGICTSCIGMAHNCHVLQRNWSIHHA